MNETVPEGDGARLQIVLRIYDYCIYARRLNIFCALIITHPESVPFLVDVSATLFLEPAPLSVTLCANVGFRATDDTVHHRR